MAYRLDRLLKLKESHAKVFRVQRLSLPLESGLQRHIRRGTGPAGAERINTQEFQQNALDLSRSLTMLIGEAGQQ